ncbi:hypothetical protein CANCADRAFT_12107, partial [Tortispora caseinolytica NRRL Y-17796]
KSDQEENVQTEARPLEPIPQPERKKRKTAYQSRPNWIVEPEHVDPNLSLPFSDKVFALNSSLLDNLHSAGIENSFAVQTSAIPYINECMRQKGSIKSHSLLVNSFTGSGKTLAYALPVLNTLWGRPSGKLRALIVLPTKPLAQQVASIFYDLSRGSDLKIALLKAGRAFTEEQSKTLKSPPDIVISTPGRLVDHLRRTEGFTLKHLQFLVIDEADRLLNQSFQDWVNVVVASCSELRRKYQPDMYNMHYLPPFMTLVFSATLTRDPRKLASLNIKNPKILLIGSTDAEYALPTGLEEFSYKVKTLKDKPLLLVHLLETRKETGRVLVFVSSNESALRLHRLVQLSSPSLAVGFCMGDSLPAEKKRVINDFTKGNIDILIATDMVARGMDIEGISLVINYDLPLSAREYVHRVGRTARAGKTGTAVAFVVGRGEWKHFHVITEPSARKQEIIEKEIEEFPDDVRLRYEKALEEFQKQL